jgi:VCBS repeat-containing protein
MTTNNRRCGDCQLCCKLLPTPEIGSLAGHRCQHQKHGVGCAIYATRPVSCQLWACAWLADGLLLPRPDRAHYVVDTMPDYISIVPHDGSEPTNIGVVQVWVDPQHRDAHKAKSFRDWLNAQRMPAVIRFNERDGFVLFPPSMSADGQWHEETSGVAERTHSLEQKAAALGGQLSISLEAEDGSTVHKVTMTVDGKERVIAAQQIGDAAKALEALEDARKIAQQRRLA